MSAKFDTIETIMEEFLAGIPALKKSWMIQADELANHFCDRYPLFGKEVDKKVFDESIYPYFQKTVIPHKIAVAKAFEENEKFFGSFLSRSEMGELGENIFIHDESKFSAEESFGYAQYDFRGANNAAQEAAFNRAWHHHKQNNPHHPEYWLNPDKTGRPHPLPMPDIYIAEMICDWVGAGKSYGNPFEKWAIQNLPTFLWHKDTANRVVDMLEVIFPKMYFEIVSNSAQIFCGETTDELLTDHDRI